MGEYQVYINCRADGSFPISYTISRRGPLAPFFFGLGGDPVGRFLLRLLKPFFRTSVSSPSSSSASLALPLSLSSAPSVSSDSPSGLSPPIQSSKSCRSSSDSPSTS